MDSEVLTVAERYMHNDRYFDELYPEYIRRIGRLHWTPVNIAKKVIGFLGDSNARILDIGSGVGKFCLTAGYCAPSIEIVGVEQRPYLIQHAIRAQKRLGLKNVSFINKNFTQLSLQDYTHFYFYNSFFENIDDVNKIDETIDYSESLYEYYARYLYKELQGMPQGTKIATFHTFDDNIPRCYRLVEVHAGGDLEFWIKQ